MRSLLAVPGLIAALAGYGGGAGYAARHYRAEPDLWYWFWLVVGTLGIVFAASLLVRPMYVDRYFVVILPADRAHAARLAVAGGVARALVRWCRRVSGPDRAAIALDAFRAGDHYKEDWRGVAQYVAADFQPATVC